MQEKYYNDDELVYLVMENSEEALDLLLMKYEPLMKSIAFYYMKTIKNYKLEYDDILQECRIALIMAVKKYDYTNSVLFYTFLIVFIRRRVYTYVRGLFAKKNDYVLFQVDEDDNYLDICDENSQSTEDLFSDYAFLEIIIHFKNELSDLESQIFELRFNSFSYKEIACLLDVNYKKIDNIMVKVRKNLKKYLFNFS